MKCIRGWLAMVLSSSAACGGVDRPSATDLSTGDASASMDASVPADGSMPADGSVPADGSATTTPAACGVGTWIFDENGDPCGNCVQGISDFVTLTIPPGMDGGGSVQDSEGNTWQYDPVACTLTASGSCNTADTIDFGKKTTSCYWTCGEQCPACAALCTFAPYP
jgi:hypothetical protein